MGGFTAGCWMLMALISAVDVIGEKVQGGVGPHFAAHRVGSYRGEACGLGDFNNDGKMDIVALPYLYLAPRFDPTMICEVAGDVDENGKGYRDDFMNVVMDVNGDGGLDVVT
jgi:hypothetical protein